VYIPLCVWIYVLLNYVSRARTRELPDNYPFVVQQTYISAVMVKWRAPALDLFDIVHKILADYIRLIVVQHFGYFGRGGLQQSVQ
jgi:hypothetical protein